MNEVEQLKHRLAMVSDDLNAIRAFIYKEGLFETFQKQTENCDEAFTHLNNIEIACDLSSEESLVWKPFSKKQRLNKSDVFKVAKDLKISINDAEAKQVLELYNDEEANDPTATWDLIVENIIYNLKR